MLSCALQPDEGHAIPILGVYDILCTCAALMLVQLAIGHPIRGGLDVGTGMVVDDELFGAAIVKAYRLESQRAGHPRLVVGHGLLNYSQDIDAGAGGGTGAADGAPNGNRALGSHHEGRGRRVNSGLRRSKGAGVHSRELERQRHPRLRSGPDVREWDRTDFRERGADGAKLFERYSKVVRYLDARASLGGTRRRLPG